MSKINLIKSDLPGAPIEPCPHGDSALESVNVPPAVAGAAAVVWPLDGVASGDDNFCHNNGPLLHHHHQNKPAQPLN